MKAASVTEGFMPGAVTADLVDPKAMAETRLAPPCKKPGAQCQSGIDEA